MSRITAPASQTDALDISALFYDLQLYTLQRTKDLLQHELSTWPGGHFRISRKLWENFHSIEKRFLSIAQSIASTQYDRDIIIAEIRSFSENVLDLPCYSIPLELVANAEGRQPRDQINEISRIFWAYAVLSEELWRMTKSCFLAAFSGQYGEQQSSEQVYSLFRTDMATKFWDTVGSIGDVGEMIDNHLSQVLFVNWDDNDWYAIRTLEECLVYSGSTTTPLEKMRISTFYQQILVNSVVEKAFQRTIALLSEIDETVPFSDIAETIAGHIIPLKHFEYDSLFFKHLMERLRNGPDTDFELLIMDFLAAHMEAATRADQSEEQFQKNLRALVDFHWCMTQVCPCEDALHLLQDYYFVWWRKQLSEKESRFQNTYEAGATRRNAPLNSFIFEGRLYLKELFDRAQVFLNACGELPERSQVTTYMKDKIASHINNIPLRSRPESLSMVEGMLEVLSRTTAMYINDVITSEDMELCEIYSTLSLVAEIIPNTKIKLFFDDTLLACVQYRLQNPQNVLENSLVNEAKVVSIFSKSKSISMKTDRCWLGLIKSYGNRAEMNKSICAQVNLGRCAPLSIDIPVHMSAIHSRYWAGQYEKPKRNEIPEGVWEEMSNYMDKYSAHNLEKKIIWSYIDSMVEVKTNMFTSDDTREREVTIRLSLAQLSVMRFLLDEEIRSPGIKTKVRDIPGEIFADRRPADEHDLSAILMKRGIVQACVNSLSTCECPLLTRVDDETEGESEPQYMVNNDFVFQEDFNLVPRILMTGWNISHSVEDDSILEKGLVAHRYRRMLLTKPGAGMEWNDAVTELFGNLNELASIPKARVVELMHSLNNITDSHGRAVRERFSVGTRMPEYVSYDYC